MNTIFLSIITLAFLVAVGVFIFVMIEIRSASKAFKDFLKNTEDNLKPAIVELEESLKSIRKAAEGITGVSDDLREFSGSVRKTGENVKRISDLIEEVTSGTVTKVFSLRAGIRAAIETLLKNLLIRG
ncbi:MAG: DUF948 domain-containing protein [Thermodesulfovibrionales bacterium]